MYPDSPIIQADRIIRIVALFVVDRKTIQMSEIDSGLLGQFGTFNLRIFQRQKAMLQPESLRSTSGICPGIFWLMTRSSITVTLWQQSLHDQRESRKKHWH